MKAFLLSAGLGTRLRPLTDKVPKCLLPVCGKPLLQIWLENLEKHGIDEVLINTHWLHEKFEVFLRKWREGQTKISVCYEPVLLGSAGTLLANRGWVDGAQPFLILNGDNLTNVNLGKMISFHCGHGLPFTLGVFRAEDPRRCGIAEAGEDGIVTAFVEKPENPKSDLAAAGVYVADCRIFDFFPEKKPLKSEALDLGFHLIPNLAGKMKIYPIRDFLMDIGTPQAYESAQGLWMERNNKT